MHRADPQTPSPRWLEIATVFLKIGVTAYGGPAIIGVMRAELQERRQWVSKERFVEGLSLIHLLPGAAATQLGIFLGHARGGWRGGLLAGLCFVLPAFFTMLALTLGYAAYGASPVFTGALYGLGPMVLAIFAVAVLRMALTSAARLPQQAIAVAAALALAWTPLGVVPILALAAGIGLTLHHSRRSGLWVLALVAALIVATHRMPWSGVGMAMTTGLAADPGTAPGLADIGAFFLTVGAFSFGGGLTLIAFIQDQVVHHHHWLTEREFIDGLALGQFTPGPILMISAYVGYKLAGLLGAAVAAAAIFAPAFLIMLSLLPIFERVGKLRWMKAAMQGIGPAVIGVLAVSLLQMTPHALPDVSTKVVFAAGLAALLAWKVGPIRLMLAGGVLGALRDRVMALLGLRPGL